MTSPLNEDSYQKLSEHLDRLPDGFATSDPDVALRLLKQLFTPEEAELARHLTLDKEEAFTIARRAGGPLSEARQRLAGMAQKGLIFSVYQKDDPCLYHAVPFFIGIFEFQVNNLNKDLLQALADYRRAKKPRRQTHISQVRTIPIGKSIKPHLEALPYEQVDELINKYDYIAIAPCICRRYEKMRGRGCDAPDESCLMFGEWAEYYVRTGRARPIDRSEVTELLARADAANLVLQPNNSQDIITFCFCCGCCCGVLKGLQKHPKPVEIVASAFIATFKPIACKECWACLERCQMHALTQENNRIVLNLDRCIGCGLCVTTCPSGALTLSRREDRRHTHTPVNMDATWRAIIQAQTAEQDGESQTSP